MYDGYCSNDGENRHDGCECYENVDTICKLHCDLDVKCKGYSFKKDGASCMYYTTSSCRHDSVIKNCTTWRHNQTIDQLLVAKDDKESGCFVKSKGTKKICTEYINDQLILSH